MSRQYDGLFVEYGTDMYANRWKMKNLQRNTVLPNCQQAKYFTPEKEKKTSFVT
jgi:hypothetical protein